MSFFQTTVTKKYANTFDKEVLKRAYATFKAHFHNAGIQENIRNSKEEQYQEGFFRDLFVNVLGYKLNPEPNFNLITENKNVKDSKKSDGAIIINGNVCAVIELKGTDTTDLSKIETQAFGYKNNQVNCSYVITSNFEKLWFYIDNAIDHLEFNLFTLTEADFELFYLCLSFEAINGNIPQKIKAESVSQEDTITKKLYKDYSLFKRELHQNLVQLNPEYDALTLFKKSQKLLDRFLFLFFAEDRNLLPPNSVRLVLNDWRDLQERDEVVPLYNRFKKYFGYLNTGFKGKRYDVFAYNGGLFKPDDLLDAIKIDDELLYKHTHKLSEYDFESEVDVNILGHIFENSLNELDEIQAQLEGQEIEKAKTKRKKDGVFYTPKYITKYIVENTVGKLCIDKKAALNLKDEEFIKKTGKAREPYFEKLKNYREWLLQLTICDPACGSGAFLNQALDFLINEHRYLDELQAKLFGDALLLNDVSKSILENNLFGVDLNEESVEIAKLSLWLRTAQPNRKLNDLNNNIKCGNSLIDDPEIAGDKAFNWKKEFPQVFKDKQKKAWHITTAIHDSRTSQRMIDYKVREKRAIESGQPDLSQPQIVPLTASEETIIVEVVSKIVIEDKLRVMAFNVCKDHIHLLLVCGEEEVSKIVQKIKAKTAREVNISRGVTVAREQIAASTMEYAPLPTHTERGEKQNSLWTQKFWCNEILDDNQLYNTVEYIKHNRVKHELPILPILQQSSMLDCLYQSYEQAFSKEYIGGFDVIIGNPPYVQIQSSKELSESLQNIGFKTFEKTTDLYCVFYELGNIILKNEGLLGFITSNKWMRANYGKPLRKYLLEHTNPYLLLDLGAGIFESATVDSNILFFKKLVTMERVGFTALDLMKEKNVLDLSVFDEKKVSINPKNDEIWIISNFLETSIKQKLEKHGTPLKNWDININRGILTGFNEAFIIDEETKNKLITEDSNNKEILKPILRGKDIQRWFPEYANLWLINTHNGYKEVPRIEISNYPSIKKHLDKYWEQLDKRYDKGSTPYNLRNCAYINDFYSDKIIYQEMVQKGEFFVDNQNYFCADTGRIITGKNLKYLVCLLNSKLFFFSIKNYYGGGGLGAVGIRMKHTFFESFPAVDIENKLIFEEKADLMLSLNKNLQEQSLKFQRTIQRKFYLTMEHAPLPIDTPLPTKLQNWYLLDYKEFIAELAKKKIKLSLADEAEWEEYFLSESKKVQAIKTEIDQTDKEIDAMVYQLYELTDEEIKIVEGN